MDKRIMTELLLLARKCDVDNRAEAILCLVNIYDILDNYVFIEVQKKDSCYEIIECEANLIWMRTHVHLLKTGIKLGHIGGYLNHLNSVRSNTQFFIGAN